MEWRHSSSHKPVLLRGARQVGKSTAVRNLANSFENFVEINFERTPVYGDLFVHDLDVKRILSQMSAMYGKRIEPGNTLLFLDEIQMCPQAIMALRFFWEDEPSLHVIAAGSLLEFALEELPTFGVGRIHSMFMYPMTFDEFLLANGEDLLLETRNSCSADNPLPMPLYKKITELLRTFILVGGLPEVVAKWVETHDYLQCQIIQDEIVLGYEDDFPKYRRHVNPTLLRLTLRSVATQMSKKFVYSEVGNGYKTAEVKRAVELLTLAGIIVPAVHTAANGLPLGSEADNSYTKMLLMDTGIALRLLNMTMGDISEMTTQILTATVADLVNKGPMAELLCGLEILHTQSPNIRTNLFYWQRMAKNSLAEIDYVTVLRQKVLPIEVKAGVKGGMKSLWLFMREKHLTHAVRCSLENFGSFSFVDKEDEDSVRHVDICPLYALTMLPQICQL